MFKDEAGGLVVTEFVGLRAKLYSFKMAIADGYKEEKKCKGIKKAVIEKHITFDDYKKCLFRVYLCKANENNECLKKS